MIDKVKPKPVPRPAADVLRLIDEATAASTGQQYFDALVRNVALALGVSCTFIARFTEDLIIANVRAFWLVDKLIDNFDYTLAGTPCELILAGEPVTIDHNVVDKFPDHRDDLEAIGANSYLAVPLCAKDGQVIGHLAVIDTAKRTWSESEIGIMRIFAARATAELQREDFEDALQATNVKLRLLKDAAESANRAKSNFLATMSHELRTPLNSILGYTQILQRRGELTESQRNAIVTIEHSGEHLLTLINDILSLSKIEAGKLELNRTDFLLRDFLDDICDIARVRAEQKGLAFRCELMSRLPKAMSGDERRLRQILLNLLSNATKFTEQGGVTFRVTYDESSAASPHLSFEVMDTGVGIPSEKGEEIFEPFHQLDGANRHGDGTGLGLAISRKLVDLMGGTITVESAPGAGSTFRVELPVPEETAVEHVSGHHHRVIGFVGPPKKVLVVDDKAENRAVLTGLLEPLGFELSEASNGREALDIAEQWRPDVILLDLVMPVMDGFETARQINRSPELKDIAILALSASVLENSRTESKAAGCWDFLPKPIRAELLLEKLRQLFDLEWVYSTPAHGFPESADLTARSSSETEYIARPSGDVLQTLHHFATRGDVQAILEESKRLETQDAGLEPFVMELRRLAGSYDMQLITEFVDPREDPPHEHGIG